MRRGWVVAGAVIAVATMVLAVAPITEAAPATGRAPHVASGHQRVAYCPGVSSYPTSTTTSCAVDNVTFLPNSISVAIVGANISQPDKLTMEGPFGASSPWTLLATGTSDVTVNGSSVHQSLWVFDQTYAASAPGGSWTVRVNTSQTATRFVVDIFDVVGATSVTAGNIAFGDGLVFWSNSTTVATNSLLIQAAYTRGSDAAMACGYDGHLIHDGQKEENQYVWAHIWDTTIRNLIVGAHIARTPGPISLEFQFGNHRRGTARCLAESTPYIGLSLVFAR